MSQNHFYDFSFFKSTSFFYLRTLIEKGKIISFLQQKQYDVL